MCWENWRDERLHFWRGTGAATPLPTEVNSRANIFGFKKLGVERIISVSAVGSLKEEYRPTDMVLPDQFFDRTRPRLHVFRRRAGGARQLRQAGLPGVETLAAACREAGVNVKQGGTYLCMEGPAFSTKAESNVYRSWGMDVIGMTSLQEAKLAREAEICYATVAMVTDYDCWHPEHDAVTINEIIGYLVKNAANACSVVLEAVAAMPESEIASAARRWPTPSSQTAVPVPAATRQKLGILIDKYFV